MVNIKKKYYKLTYSYFYRVKIPFLTSPNMPLAKETIRLSHKF